MSISEKLPNNDNEWCTRCYYMHQHNSMPAYRKKWYSYVCEEVHHWFDPSAHVAHNRTIVQLSSNIIKYLSFFFFIAALLLENVCWRYKGRRTVFDVDIKKYLWTSSNAFVWKLFTCACSFSNIQSDWALSEQADEHHPNEWSCIEAICCCTCSAYIQIYICVTYNRPIY